MFCYKVGEKLYISVGHHDEFGTSDTGYVDQVVSGLGRRRFQPVHYVGQLVAVGGGHGQATRGEQDGRRHRRYYGARRRCHTSRPRRRVDFLT
jgi:hypothetical protein